MPAPTQAAHADICRSIGIRLQADHRRGATFHEAGHADVAWSLGLQVGDIAIGIGGGDAKGGAQMEAAFQ